MTELPCDDLHCICCHPEEMHACDGPTGPVNPGHVSPWTCPECGTTWSKHRGRPPYWPENLRWHAGDREWWDADQRVPTKSEIAARGGAS